MNQSIHKRVARVLSYLSVSLLLFSLTACSSIVTQQDYDPSRNFADYHTWSWKDPAVIFSPNNSLTRNGLTEQRINEALDAQLPAKGLTPAGQKARSDLQLQVTLANVIHRQDVPNNFYGGPWGGGPWGGPWNGPGGPWGPWGPWNGGPYGYSTIETRGILLQLDMYDGKDGKLVWRGRVAEPVNDPTDPAQRSQAISELVQAVLSKYPPP